MHLKNLMIQVFQCATILNFNLALRKRENTENTEPFEHTGHTLLVLEMV